MVRMFSPTKLAALAFFAAASVSDGAISYWLTQNGGNGHGYEVVMFPSTGSFTWNDAKILAEKRGGHLATVTSAAEDAFVSSMIMESKYWYFLPNGVPGVDFWDGPWIGGFQKPGSNEPAGGWQWVTGEPFAYNGWHSTQPDDLFGGMTDQNRLHYWDKGDKPSLSQVVPKWDDVRPGTDWIPAYVVEYIPEPSVPILALSGLAPLFLRRRR